MKIVDWGLIPYQTAVEQQLQLVDKVIADVDNQTLVFCSHPPVVTLGRGSKPTDLLDWQGETVEVSRGGRATYHGPSQIVVYPIINLAASRTNLLPRDLHAYTQILGESIVSTLREFAIGAEMRTFSSGDAPSLTGVWVGEKKIASIGFAVRKWVTYHGLALNMEYDPDAFKGINPCGFQSSIMCSMESVLELPVKRADVQSVLQTELLRRLQPLDLNHEKNSISLL